MATITTRAGKGSPLTNTEVDDNFTNLNTAKYESGSVPTFGDVTISEASPLLRIQESGSGGSKRLDLSVDSSAVATIAANQSAQTMVFEVSNSEVVRFNYNTDGVVFNEDSLDRDFRVESNDQTHIFFIDASTNQVAVGTSGVTSGFIFGVQGSATVGDRASNISSGGYELELSGVSIPDVDSTPYGSYGGLRFYTNQSFTSSSRQVYLTNGYRTNQFAVLVGTSNYSSAPDIQGVAGQPQNAEVALAIENTGSVVVNQESSAGVDFRVESDANSAALFVDASSSYTGINGTPAVELDIQRVANAYPLRIGSSGGEGRGLVIADVAGTPAKYNFFVGAQQNLDNTFEITPSTVVGGYTFSHPAISVQSGGGVVINEGGQNADFRVESSDKAYLFYIDASNNGVGIGDGYTLANGLMIASSTATTNAVDYKLYLNAKSTGTTTTGFGPGIVMAGDRNGDGATQQMARIQAEAEVNSGTNLSSALVFYSADAGVNAERLRLHYDGKVRIGNSSDHVMVDVTASNAAIQLVDNNQTNPPTLRGNGPNFHIENQGAKRFSDYSGSTVINEDGLNQDFRVESDNSTNAIYVDASSDSVGIRRVPDVNGYYALDVGGIIRMGDGNLVAGVCYPYVRTVSRPVGSGAQWYKIYSETSSPSPRTVYLKVTASGDNTSWSGNFIIGLAGYNFTHSIVLEDYQYYNQPKLTHIKTVNPGGTTTTEIWVRVEAINSSVGTLTVQSSSGALVSSLSAASEPSATTGTVQLTNANWPASSARSSMAVTGPIMFGGDSAKATFWRDSMARSSSIYHNNDGMKIETNNGGDNLDVTVAGGNLDFYIPTNYEAAFNENGNNADFRVESDSNANMLFVDGSANVVFIGGTTTGQNVIHLDAGRIMLDKTTDWNIESGGSANGSHIRFRQSNADVGSITSTSSGTTYATTSDRRLKENIQTITDATDKLMAMNPVKHTWKADPEADAVHGFIAQEMMDIVPEAISGDPEGEEMMSMDYGRITPVLVAALQDAHKKIAELETRLNETEGK